MPITRESKSDGQRRRTRPKEFTAPQPRLFANIIEGILGGRLQWSLIITGVMIAIVLELCGVSALPVAVGMYLSLGSTTPIFIGGLMRLIADRLRGKPKSEAEAETSPGVLLASGYIAGGTLCGLIVAFFAFLPDSFNETLNLGLHLFGSRESEDRQDRLEAGRGTRRDDRRGRRVRSPGGVSGLHRQPQGEDGCVVHLGNHVYNENSL